VCFWRTGARRHLVGRGVRGGARAFGRTAAPFGRSGAAAGAARAPPRASARSARRLLSSPLCSRSARARALPPRSPAGIALQKTETFSFLFNRLQVWRGASRSCRAAGHRVVYCRRQARSSERPRSRSATAARRGFLKRFYFFACHSDVSSGF
jgi:hypothetical protein